MDNENHIWKQKNEMIDSLIRQIKELSEIYDQQLAARDTEITRMREGIQTNRYLQAAQDMNSVLNVRIRELERQVYFQQDALKRADKWREALLFIARYDPYGAQWTAEKCLRETGSLAPQEVPTGGHAA